MTPQVEEQARVLYAVFPGYVTSANDGDAHFIGASQLMNLYGVSSCDCVIVEGRRIYSHVNIDGLIPLRPRYDGNYNIAHVIQEMPWA